MTADDLEFVRFQQVTDAIGNLAGWKIRGGIEFDIPIDTEFFELDFLLVSFDPKLPENVKRLEAFYSEFPDIHRQTTIVGPFSGQLSNRGDLVRILGTYDQGIPDAVNVLSDEVIYDDLSPWPTAADGGGKSLHRNFQLHPFGAVVGFGSDPRNWQAKTPGKRDFPNITGDLNGNGALDLRDIELMVDSILDFGFGPDLNGDGSLDRRDYEFLIRELFETNYGDANLDRVFDSKDLIMIFQVGEYEDGIARNSTWSEGDWNGDGDFDSSDLVSAFQSGWYSFESENRDRSSLLLVQEIARTRSPVGRFLD
jgi:hypothetical protein